jgi:hydrogenase nickel incorporation protein HypA/HybF
VDATLTTAHRCPTVLRSARLDESAARLSLRAMHELALAESVVAAVTERLGDARVTAVRLEVGRLAAVVPDALRFCFEVCTRGTSLDGATLDILEIPARGHCRACGARELSFEGFPALCPCGSPDIDLCTGQELRIKEVEVP